MSFLPVSPVRATFQPSTPKTSFIPEEIRPTFKAPSPIPTPPADNRTPEEIASAVAWQKYANDHKKRWGSVPTSLPAPAYTPAGVYRAENEFERTVPYEYMAYLEYQKTEQYEHQFRLAHQAQQPRMVSVPGEQMSMAQWHDEMYDLYKYRWAQFQETEQYEHMTRLENWTPGLYAYVSGVTHPVPHIIARDINIDEAVHDKLRALSDWMRASIPRLETTAPQMAFAPQVGGVGFGVGVGAGGPNFASQVARRIVSGIDLANESLPWWAILNPAILSGTALGYATWAFQAGTQYMLVGTAASQWISKLSERAFFLINKYATPGGGPGFIAMQSQSGLGAAFLPPEVRKSYEETYASMEIQYTWERARFEDFVTNDDGSMNWDRFMGLRGSIEREGATGELPGERGGYKLGSIKWDTGENLQDVWLHNTGLTGLGFTFLLHPEREELFMRAVEGYTDPDGVVHEPQLVEDVTAEYMDPIAELIGNTLTDPSWFLPNEVNMILFPPGILLSAVASKATALVSRTVLGKLAVASMGPEEAARWLHLSVEAVQSPEAVASAYAIQKLALERIVKAGPGELLSVATRQQAAQELVHLQTAYKAATHPGQGASLGKIRDWLITIGKKERLANYSDDTNDAWMQAMLSGARREGEEMSVFIGRIYNDPDLLKAPGDIATRQIQIFADTVADLKASGYRNFDDVLKNAGRAGKMGEIDELTGVAEFGEMLLRKGPFQDEFKQWEAMNPQIPSQERVGTAMVYLATRAAVGVERKRLGLLAGTQGSFARAYEWSMNFLRANLLFSGRYLTGNALGDNMRMMVAGYRPSFFNFGESARLAVKLRDEFGIAGLPAGIEKTFLAEVIGMSSHDVAAAHVPFPLIGRPGTVAQDFYNAIGRKMPVGMKEFFEGDTLLARVLNRGNYTEALERTSHISGELERMRRATVMSQAFDAHMGVYTMPAFKKFISDTDWIPPTMKGPILDALERGRMSPDDWEALRHAVPMPDKPFVPITWFEPKGAPDTDAVRAFRAGAKKVQQRYYNADMMHSPQYADDLVRYADDQLAITQDRVGAQLRGILNQTETSAEKLRRLARGEEFHATGGAPHATYVADQQSHVYFGDSLRNYLQSQGGQRATGMFVEGSWFFGETDDLTLLRGASQVLKKDLPRAGVTAKPLGQLRPHNALSFNEQRLDPSFDAILRADELLGVDLEGAAQSLIDAGVSPLTRVRVQDMDGVKIPAVTLADLVKPAPVIENIIPGGIEPVAALREFSQEPHIYVYHREAKQVSAGKTLEEAAAGAGFKSAASESEILTRGVRMRYNRAERILEIDFPTNLTKEEKVYMARKLLARGADPSATIRQWEGALDLGSLAQLAQTRLGGERLGYGQMVDMAHLLGESYDYDYSEIHYLLDTETGRLFNYQQTRVDTLTAGRKLGLGEDTTIRMFQRPSEGSTLFVDVPTSMTDADVLRGLVKANITEGELITIRRVDSETGSIVNHPYQLKRGQLRAAPGHKHPFIETHAPAVEADPNEVPIGRPPTESWARDGVPKTAAYEQKSFKYAFESAFGEGVLEDYPDLANPYMQARLARHMGGMGYFEGDNLLGKDVLARLRWADEHPDTVLNMLTRDLGWDNDRLAARLNELRAEMGDAFTLPGALNAIMDEETDRLFSPLIAELQPKATGITRTKFQMQYEVPYGKPVIPGQPVEGQVPWTGDSVQRMKYGQFADLDPGTGEARELTAPRDPFPSGEFRDIKDLTPDYVSHHIHETGAKDAPPSSHFVTINLETGDSVRASLPSGYEHLATDAYPLRLEIGGAGKGGWKADQVVTGSLTRGHVWLNEVPAGYQPGQGAMAFATGAPNLPPSMVISEDTAKLFGPGTRLELTAAEWRQVSETYEADGLLASVYRASTRNEPVPVPSWLGAAEDRTDYAFIHHANARVEGNVIDDIKLIMGSSGDIHIYVNPRGGQLVYTRVPGMGVATPEFVELGYSPSRGTLWQISDIPAGEPLDQIEAVLKGAGAPPLELKPGQVAARAPGAVQPRGLAVPEAVAAPRLPAGQVWYRSPTGETNAANIQDLFDQYTNKFTTEGGALKGAFSANAKRWGWSEGDHDFALGAALGIDQKMVPHQAMEGIITATLNPADGSLTIERSLNHLQEAAQALLDDGVDPSTVLRWGNAHGRLDAVAQNGMLAGTKFEEPVQRVYDLARGTAKDFGEFMNALKGLGGAEAVGSGAYAGGDLIAWTKGPNHNPSVQRVKPGAKVADPGVVKFDIQQVSDMGGNVLVIRAGDPQLARDLAVRLRQLGGDLMGDTPCHVYLSGEVPSTYAGALSQNRLEITLDDFIEGKIGPKSGQMQGVQSGLDQSRLAQRNEQLQPLVEEWQAYLNYMAEFKKNVRAWSAGAGEGLPPGTTRGRGAGGERGGMYWTYEDRKRWDEVITKLKQNWTDEVHANLLWAGQEVYNILFDYAVRLNPESLFRYYSPFTTYQLRNPLFWAQALMARPGLIGMAHRLYSATEIERQRLNLSTRFKGTMGVNIPENPVLPEGYYGFNAMSVFDIFNQIQEPFDSPQWAPEAGAPAALAAIVKAGKWASMRPFPWIDWGLELAGAVAPEITGGTVKQAIDRTLLSGLPFGFPQRLLVAVLRTGGVLPPASGAWTETFVTDYNTARRVAEMEAEGRIGHMEALRALADRRGSVWSEASQFVTQQGLRTLLLNQLIPLNIKYSSPGEQKIRDLKAAEASSQEYPFLETYQTAMAGSEVPMQKGSEELIASRQKEAQRAELYARYEQEMLYLVPGTPQYTAKIVQRQQELNRLGLTQAQPSGLRPAQLQLDERPFWTLLRNAKEFSDPQILGAMNDMIPRAEDYRLPDGSIDWDKYNTANTTFQESVPELAAQLGLKLTPQQWQKYRDKYRSAIQIAYDEYRDQVSEGWEILDSLEPGGAEFNSARRKYIADLYMKASMSGMTAQEIADYVSEKWMEIDTYGLPFDYTAGFVGDKLSPADASKFAVEVATRMGRYEPAEVVATTAELRGKVFGEPDPEENIIGYYNALDPIEQRLVRKRFGFLPGETGKSFTQWVKGLEPDQQQRLWAYAAGPESWWRLGRISSPVSDELFPAYDGISQQQKDDLDQLDRDWFLYGRAQAEGRLGFYTDLMEKYYSDPDTYESKFWTELNTTALNSSAFEDPVMGAAMDRIARGVLDFTDKQWQDMYEYFKLHKERFTDEVKTRALNENPEWLDKALYERRVVTSMRLTAMEDLRAYYYNTPWKERDAWQAKNREQWLDLIVYNKYRQANEIGSPYYMYFYDAANYNRHFGGLTPPQAEKRAAQLSVLYTQGFRDYQMWRLHGGPWTHAMEVFLGPNPFEQKVAPPPIEPPPFPK